MKIDTVRLVYFSPTGTTRRVLAGIAEGLGAARILVHDLTSPSEAGERVTAGPDEVVLFGMPVYSGRVVREAIPRVKRISGKALAVPVVVYGNRDYEDALLEWRDLVAGQGFTPFAAAAFIGEHSFSTAERPLAAGRPDAADLEKARAFGEALLAAIEKLGGAGEASLVGVPGKTPYIERDRSHVEKASTRTIAEICTLCGACEAVCPTGAVRVGETVETDVSGCILCAACVRACPTDARVLDDPGMEKVAQWLYDNFKARREPEIFVAS